MELEQPHALGSRFDDDVGVLASRRRRVRTPEQEHSGQGLAQRGRAAYAGERSRGSVDAGAIAIAVIFEEVSRAWSPTSV